MNDHINRSYAILPVLLHVALQQVHSTNLLLEWSIIRQHVLLVQELRLFFFWTVAFIMAIARMAALKHGVLGLLDDSKRTAATHHQCGVV